MNIALFIHELILETGHGRAIIEKLCNLPRDKKYRLKVICFKSDNPQKILPDNFNVEIIKFPYCSEPKPFLLKAILFNLFSLYYKCIVLNSSYKTISIGTASLSADIIEVPFIHTQYSPIYFNAKLPLLKRIYKRILFIYFQFCEDLVYSSNAKIFSVSRFMKEYIREIYHKKCQVIYHGINSSHFPEKMGSKKSSIEFLGIHYPQLKDLDLSQEIYLFVGALERKGIHETLSRLDKKESYQLIVVGNAEGRIQLTTSDSKKVIHISYTKYIDQFYQLSDNFIFPTLYEPFGLVLTEAAWMGLRIYTRKTMVGAFEILEGLEEVHNLEQIDNLPTLGPLSAKQKEELALKRRPIIKSYSWKVAGEKLFEVLKD